MFCSEVGGGCDERVTAGGPDPEDTWSHQFSDSVFFIVLPFASAAQRLRLQFMIHFFAFLFYFFGYDRMITFTGDLGNTEESYIWFHYILQLFF